MTGTRRVIRAGERFGRLTVIGERLPGEPIKCRCNCGNYHSVSLGQWGVTRSCGCLKTAVGSGRYASGSPDPCVRTCPQCKRQFRVKFPSARKSFCSQSCGASSRQKTRVMERNSNWRGGKSKHLLYDTYMDMIGRCHRPTHAAFANYGGRGIKVCERWRADFWAFVADMGERPKGLSLDRINNDKGYSPENCRWANQSMQMKNRRRHGYETRERNPAGQFMPGGERVA